MRARLLAASIVAALAVPVPGLAKVDPSCPPTGATSAVAGTVGDALGRPLAGLTVELYPANSGAPLRDTGLTDAQGRYRVCAGGSGGQGHNAYDVHVRDARPAPRYATVNQPYTTIANVGDADFTPASGRPLLFTTNLTVDPAEISTAEGPVSVRFTARSKAPAATTMKLRLDHATNPSDPQGEFPMSPAAPEGGGPEAGGWNVWTFGDIFPKGSTERLLFANLRGLEGSVVLTQTDRQPYVIDNRAPLFGKAEAGVDQCGPGVYANDFTPGPPGTTNPVPVVTHGVCDHWSNGARSGVDPFSLSGTMCRDAALTDGCRAIRPVLNVSTIVWWPSSPLERGDYFLRWHVADYAGNAAQSRVLTLTITDQGGQTPVIGALQPGNLSPGGNNGIIVGVSAASPTSVPHVGFRVTDYDGQRDIVAGSLQVRVFYGLDATLVYEYDASMGATEYDPISRRGGGTFDIAGGGFRAGYGLQGKPPGRYIATAAVTDYGGNTATMTWHWILAAAV